MLSTRNCWPSLFESWSVTMRPITSGEVPAPTESTMRTGLVGQFCACAAHDAAAISAAAINFIMGCLSVERIFAGLRLVGMLDAVDARSEHRRPRFHRGGSDVGGSKHV